MGIMLKATQKSLLEKGVTQKTLVEKVYETDCCGEEIVTTVEVNTYAIPGVGVVRSYHPVDLLIDNKNVNHHIREALDSLGVKYTRG